MTSARVSFFASESIRVSYFQFGFFAAALAFCVCIPMNHRQDDAQPDSEERLLRLPISSTRLALTPIVPSFIFALAAAGPLSLLFSLIEEPVIAPWTFVSTVILLVAIFRMVAVLSLWLTLIVVMGIGCYVFAVIRFVGDLFPFYDAWSWAYCLIAVPLCLAAAVVATDRRRHAVGTPRTEFQSRGKSRDWRRRRKPFASAREAQLWFEWREHGWALPLAIGFVTAVLFVCFRSLGLFDFNEPHWDAEYYAVDPDYLWGGFSAMLLLICVTAPFLARYATTLAQMKRKRSSGEQMDDDKSSAFQWTLPRSHTFFIGAKRKSVARSLTMSAILYALFAFYVVRYLPFGNWIENLETINRGTLPSLVAIPIFFLGPAAIIAVCFYGTLGLTVGSLFLALIASVGIDGLATFGIHLPKAPLMLSLVAVCVLTDILIVFSTGYRGRRAGILHRRDAVLFALLWGFGVITFGSYMLSYHSFDSLAVFFGSYSTAIGIAVLLIGIAVALMPAATIIYEPIEYVRDRHQE